MHVVHVRHLYAPSLLPHFVIGRPQFASHFTGIPAFLSESIETA